MLHLQELQNSLKIQKWRVMRNQMKEKDRLRRNGVVQMNEVTMVRI